VQQENHRGRLARGDIRETPKWLIGGYSFSMISGGVSVNCEGKEGIEYKIYL
jgi:hypothetical protein